MQNEFEELEKIHHNRQRNPAKETKRKYAVGSIKPNSLWDKKPVDPKVFVPVPIYQLQNPPVNQKLVYRGLPIPDEIDAPLLKASADKTPFELHVGGLPVQLEDDEALRQFLNESAVKQLTFKNPGEPISVCRINKVGHFAFILCRTPEEATICLGLSGTPCLGSVLKVGRPKGYLDKFEKKDLDEAQLLSQAIIKTEIPAFMKRDELKLLLQIEIDQEQMKQSNNVIIFNALDNVSNQEIYNEVKSEVEKHFGKIEYGLIDMSRNGVVLRFVNLEDAKKCFDMISLHTFDGRVLKSEYMNDDDFFNLKSQYEA